MTCNEQYEMRVETMDDMSLDGMSRLVCGFMNTVHPGSQILSGIQPDYPSVSKATVVGMPCDQEARDRFRVCFSKLMSQQITPPIMSGTITTRFWPVVDGDSREPIDDLFVIGIVIRKPTTYFLWAFLRSCHFWSHCEVVTPGETSCRSAAISCHMDLFFVILSVNAP